MQSKVFFLMAVYILVFFTGCQESEEEKNDDSLNFNSIHISNSGREHTHSLYKKMENMNEVKELFPLAEQYFPENFNEFDFEKNLIVALSTGMKTNNCHLIDFLKLYYNKDKLLNFVFEEISPDESCSCGEVVTSPLTLVFVEKEEIKKVLSDKYELNFNVTQKLDCRN